MKRARVFLSAPFTVSLALLAASAVGCGSSSSPPTNNTTIALTNSSTTLTYTADLHTLHPTGVPANTAALKLDWGMMKTNALGSTFIPTNIAHAIVGHYTQTPTQLETQFLDLQTIAQTLYSIDIPSGTEVDFSMLTDKDGNNTFKGIDSTGTWLVALICTTCRNPAPWYLTILQPNPSGCTGGSTSGNVTCTDGSIVANEVNDYKFTSSLMLHPVKVKQMSDLTIDWSAVTKNFLGHAVNPKTDLNTIFLLMVDTPASEFEMQLNDDTFSTSSIVIPGPPPFYIPMNGETSKTLYNNFTSGDGPVTAALANMYLDASKYMPSNSTFAIGAQSGTNVGTGQIHMLQSFELEK